MFYIVCHEKIKTYTKLPNARCILSVALQKAFYQSCRACIFLFPALRFISTASTASYLRSLLDNMRNVIVLAWFLTLRLCTDQALRKCYDQQGSVSLNDLRAIRRPKSLSAAEKAEPASRAFTANRPCDTIQKSSLTVTLLWEVARTLPGRISCPLT